MNRSHMSLSCLKIQRSLPPNKFFNYKGLVNSKHDCKSTLTQSLVEINIERRILTRTFTGQTSLIRPIRLWSLPSRVTFVHLLTRERGHDEIYDTCVKYSVHPTRMIINYFWVTDSTITGNFTK